MAKVSKFDDVNKIIESVNSNSKTKRHIIKNLMTKYELDCILNLRTTQLSYGAHPFISKIIINKIEVNISELKIKNNMELRVIAIEELKKGVIPLLVKRTYPNNVTEYIRVCDLDMTAVEYLLN
jgi:DNA-directed RNA polymerase subunit K/omega